MLELLKPAPATQVVHETFESQIHPGCHFKHTLTNSHDICQTPMLQVCGTCFCKETTHQSATSE